MNGFKDGVDFFSTSTTGGLGGDGGMDRAGIVPAYKLKEDAVRIEADTDGATEGVGVSMLGVGPPVSESRSDSGYTWGCVSSGSDSVTEARSREGESGI